MDRVTTLNTLEAGLGPTTASIETATRGAFLRCVSRVYRHDWDANQSRFVRDIRLKPVERPGVMSRTLRLTDSSYPLVDASQLFDGNSATGAFSIGNNVFGQTVIHIAFESALFAAQLLKSALGTLCANTLKECFTICIPDPLCLDRVIGPHVTITGHCDVGNTHIDADKVNRLVRLRLCNRAGNVQEELAAPIDQRRTVRAACQEAAVVLIGEPVELDPTADSGYRKTIVFQETPQPNVEFDAVAPFEPTQFSDPALCCAVFVLGISRALVLVQYLVGLRDAGKTTDDMVGSEVGVSRAHRVVQVVVQIVLTVNIVFPGVQTDVVAGGVVVRHGLPEQFGLLPISVYLESGNNRHHEHKYSTNVLA